MADERISISDVSSVPSYKWDGISRPQLSDYTAPYAQYSAMTERKDTAWRKSREHNSAIAYAKSMMEIANAQYEDDLSYWQEMNERAYTTPLAQSGRYEQAGYNMGYMYGSVDSGNSAVGFDNPNSSITPHSGENHTLEYLQAVSSVVSQAVGVVTSLAKSGIDISKVGLELDSLRGNNAAIKLANDWQKILQSTDFEGNKVSDVTKSLAFSLQAIGYKHGEQQLRLGEQQLRLGEQQYRSGEQQIELGSKELQRLNSFLKYCDKIYENQSTNPKAEIIQGIADFINHMDFSWAGQYQDLVKQVVRMIGFTSAIKLVGN